MEQDLWNLVFKSQISYFQSQIKENSISSSNNSNSSSSNTSSTKSNKTVSSQKRIEAQASLFFFLEAARGFYTKLLEDIVTIYDSKEVEKLIGNNFLLPFCQRYTSVFDKINANKYSTQSTENNTKILVSALTTGKLYITMIINFLIQINLLYLFLKIFLFS